MQRAVYLPIPTVKCVKRPRVVNLVAASLVVANPLFERFNANRVAQRVRSLLAARSVCARLD